MWRILIAFSLLCVTTLVLAAEPSVPMTIPSFFKPVPDDLSIWFLGNIFGSDLIQGDKISDIKLLSRVFGMFNQVALTVGMIIVVYTIIAGSLNTAHEGKPLGEKWNSVWMPVRTSLGIAMLVPKGGSGYCMAQYLVMWLTLQGIGAADTVWGTMLDYFEQGGAIYSGTTGSSANYLNADSVDPVYALGAGVQPGGCTRSCPIKTPLLNNMTCIEDFNQDPAAQQLMGINKFEVYAPDTTNRPDLIFFGNRAAADKKQLPTGNTKDSIPGAECGYVMMGSRSAVSKAIGSPSSFFTSRTKSQNYNTPENQIYGMAAYNYAKTLQGAARAIVAASKDQTVSESQTTLANSDIRHGVQLFVNYIAGYSSVLSPPKDTKRTSALNELRRYGWILAGNYYSILSAYKEDVAMGISGKYTAPAFPPLGYQAPANLSDATYYEALKGYQSQLDAWGNDTITEQGESTLVFYDMPGFGVAGNTGSVTGAPGGTKKYATGVKALDAKNEKWIGIVDTGKLLEAIKGKNLKSPTLKLSEQLIRTMTGESIGGREVAKDPIMRAAEYGKDLTDGAVVLFTSYLGASAVVAMSASNMAGFVGSAYSYMAIAQLITPGMMALGTFMYAGGAMLGIFLPLIPAISFLTAAIGWILQCIESIAAAPLVAIGLIMPESKDEIWGRAAPAYMLTLNLFLRPSLMIVGFGAAMIVTWILVSMLNITFLILLSVSFQIESLFGFVTVLMAYSGLLLYMVTEAYSLVVMVPNKVLHWIGDQSMGVKGAEQALSGAKADVEKGSAAVGAGVQHSGEAHTKAGELGAKAQDFKQQQKIDAAAKKTGDDKKNDGTSNPPAAT